MASYPQLESLPQAPLVTLSSGQRVNEQGGSLARRRYQQGSLMLRNRTWVARWREDVVGLDGRVKRVRKAQLVGTLAELPTKKLARRQLALLLAKVNAIGYRPGRVATLQQFSERWRTEILAQRKPSTIAAAEGHLENHILPELGKLRLEEITVERQQAFVTVLAARMSRKTLFNVLGTLSAILSTAVAWGYLGEPVNRRKLAFPSRRERPRRRFFTAEEIRRIVQAASEPYATLYLTAALTGMRQGELIGLKVVDLDFDRKLIHVRRSVWRGKLQSTKSEASMRVLHMPEHLTIRLKQHLQSWRPNPGGFLFTSRVGTPINPHHLVARRLQPLLASLGIERAGMHAFRHSHSSLLVEMGAPITVAQAQLGHSDPTTTMRAYTHLMPQSQRDAVNRLGVMLDSNGLKTEAKPLN